MTAQIQRIDHVRGFGSFRDWECEDELPDFKRYNLIYGWNGSGKSTLARLLRAIETKELHDLAAPSHCSFVIRMADSPAISPGNIGETGVSVRVFNEDFIDENVRFDTATVSPLLILGKENLDAAVELADLRERRIRVDEGIQSVGAERRRVHNAMERLLVDGARDVKKLFRDGPDDRFHTYDRGHFKSAIAGLEEHTERQETDASLLETRLKEEPKPGLEVKRGLEASELLSLWDELGGVLATTIPDTSIPELRRRAEIQEWVSVGVDLHADRDERCLFCDQDMPAERMEALRRHFTSAFTSLVTAIGVLIEGFEQFQRDVASYARSVSDVGDDRLYEHLLDGWEVLPDALERASDLVEAVVGKCLHALGEKKSDPFDPVEISISKREIDTAVAALEEAIGSIERVIETQENRTSNIEELRIDAQSQLEEHMAWEARPEYLKLIGQLGLLESADSDLSGCLTKLDDAIRAQDSRVGGTQHACDELNGAFERYFGHDMFAVSTSRRGKPGGLALHRRGTPAQHLSQGERTGIALVYFLLKLEEDGTDLAKTIVVVDDPISSLDDNSAYQAFGSMFDATLNAAQVIYLTHSFSMFRSLRQRFVRGSDNLRHSFQIFMIRRTVDEGGPRSSLERIDPTLAKYDSEYHFLFVSLYRFANAESPTALDVYTMANIGRRVLETFLAFRKPVGKRFADKVRECDFDVAKTERILRFVDYYSHGDSTARLDSIGQLGNIEAREVAHEILKLMERVDPNHVQDMKTHVGGSRE